jgi:hypothetical protein
MKRNFPTWFVFLAVLAIIAPVFPARSKVMLVSMCGGEARSITLAPDPSIPSKEDERDACKKVCHAANERRNRICGATIHCC